MEDTMNEQQSPAYAAVRHILTTPNVADRCAPHIREQDFDWSRLLTESATMSGGEQLLVRIAHDLWEASGAVGIGELPRRLGPASFERVIDALELYRGDLPRRTNQVLYEVA